MWKLPNPSVETMQLGGTLIINIVVASCQWLDRGWMKNEADWLRLDWSGIIVARKVTNDDAPPLTNKIPK